MRYFIVLLLILFTNILFSQAISDTIINNLGKVDSEFVYNADNLVLIPNTNIKMQAPEYFLISENIPGLLHPGSSATVQVQEVKGTSYIMISQAMTEEHFQSQGVRLISTTDVTMQDGKGGILYLVEFEASGIIYERLMLFAGDYNNTIWINANYPKSAKKLLQDILTQSLLTAQYIKQ
ncbi:MAG: hypothetical protein GX793_06485 [Bacteroidales bacterium]|nr:hypothetical protein [Bacteroidales bacterium]MCK9498506.1 hypothetical protein [Bacteroidales bacterium]MDY0313999.1 hypothetical protein [Bacteroidales bacterium]NLB86690.1 hypothetical protein [Bacteroidales bacterium]